MPGRLARHDGAGRLHEDRGVVVDDFAADRLRAEPWARGALAGIGAVVVGVLAAALWNPILISTVRQPADWAMVAAAFVFLQVARLPPWLVVIGFAIATGVFLPTEV